MNISSARSCVRAAMTLALTAVLLATATTAAHADSDQHVSGSGTDGLWLHDSPGLHTPLLFVAPEGSDMTAHCYGLSDAVTSSISNADPVWLKVTVDGTDGWVSDAYVDTIWSTVDDLDAAGIPACDSISSDSEGDTGGSTDQTPQPTVPDAVIHYDGDQIPYESGSYPLAYKLWDHYLWDNGRAAVVAPDYFTNEPSFRDAVMALPIGSVSTWSPANKIGDLFLAVGTFTISHETDNCWAAYDHYDFTPDKIANLAYLGYWVYQVSGAREFDVHSSGCF